MITYCCFYIYSYIGQLIEKRRYERKVAKKVLQNYQVDLSDRATNITSHAPYRAITLTHSTIQ